MQALSFALPSALEATAPPEARGLTRDSVRMLVASRSTGSLEHSSFSFLASYLEPGDLVVVNTSGTLAAAVEGMSVEGDPIVVHFSVELHPFTWVVELRRPSRRSSERWRAIDGPVPRRVVLGRTDPVLGASAAFLELIAPFKQSSRLWIARVTTPSAIEVTRWLAVHGHPIRYGYVERPWPLAYYQNVLVSEPGSAEMPSAGRPFTPEVVTRLVAKGVGVSPIVLHTGVASLEAGETPYPEHAMVPESTARQVNLAKEAGRRVVAIGTTVVRALESAWCDATGEVHEYNGWTELVVSPASGVRVVDGLLTGWHEPEASHLLMLEAIAGRALVEASYEAALAEEYLWHEFGDVHLVLP